MEHRKEIVEKSFLLNDNHLHSSGLDLSRIVVTQGHGWKGDKDQFLGDLGCREVQKLSLTIISPSFPLSSLLSGKISYVQKGLLPTQIGFKVQRSSFSETFTQRQNIHHNVINYLS